MKGRLWQSNKVKGRVGKFPNSAIRLNGEVWLFVTEPPARATSVQMSERQIPDEDSKCHCAPPRQLACASWIDCEWTVQQTAQAERGGLTARVAVEEVCFTSRVDRPYSRARLIILVRERWK